MIKCFEVAFFQSCESRTKKKRFIEDFASLCVYILAVSNSPLHAAILYIL